MILSDKLAFPTKVADGGMHQQRHIIRVGRIATTHSNGLRHERYGMFIRVQTFGLGGHWMEVGKLSLYDELSVCDNSFQGDF